MNEEYANLMAEAKNKDEKAYTILKKLKDHPFYFYIVPYHQKLKCGCEILLLAPFIMWIAYLFEGWHGNGLCFFLLFTAAIMEVVGVWLVYPCLKVIWERKKQPETEEEEQMPFKFLLFGIIASILYFMTYVANLAGLQLPMFGIISEMTKYTSFFSIWSAVAMYLLIIWGYCKDLSAITFPKEDYEYLNNYFKDNAEKDSMDNIIGRYYSDEEGVVYYRKGNHISIVLPAGTLPPKFENAFKAELLKENKEVSNNE